MVIALEHFDANRGLQISGIDLDSGERLTISIAPAGEAAPAAANATGLILSLSLHESPLSLKPTKRRSP